MQVAHFIALFGSLLDCKKYALLNRYDDDLEIKCVEFVLLDYRKYNRISRAISKYFNWPTIIGKRIELSIRSSNSRHKLFNFSLEITATFCESSNTNDINLMTRSSSIT